MRKLEVLEEYILDGEKRYRVRVAGTRLVVNVSAKSPEEAIENARKLLERTKIWDVLR